MSALFSCRTHNSCGVVSMSECVGDSGIVGSILLCQLLTVPCNVGCYYERIHRMICPLNHTTPMDAVSQLNLKDLCVCVSGYEKILAFECVPCYIGVYSPLINSSCILSPVGSFVPHIAMSHHIQRQANFAPTISGSAFCVPCP